MTASGTAWPSCVSVRVTVTVVFKPESCAVMTIRSPTMIQQGHRLSEDGTVFKFTESMPQQPTGPGVIVMMIQQGPV